jgi:hypothetical protein
LVRSSACSRNHYDYFVRRLADRRAFDICLTAPGHMDSSCNPSLDRNLPPRIRTRG